MGVGVGVSVGVGVGVTVAVTVIVTGGAVVVAVAVTVTGGAVVVAVMVVVVVDVAEEQTPNISEVITSKAIIIKIGFFIYSHSIVEGGLDVIS